MKYQWQIFSFLGLVSLAACNTTEQIGESLSPDEITYVGNASFNKCLEDSNADLNDLIAESNAALNSYIAKSTAWTYKYNSNGVSTEGYILFWKNAAPNYYFLVSLEREGVPSSRFYKITTTTNADMFKDLQEKRCRKTTGLTISMSASTASVTIDEGTQTSSSDSTLRLRYKEVYSLKGSLPAFFGYLASKKTVDTLNSSDTVTKTQTYEYTIASRSTTPTIPGTGLYTDYPVTGRDYRMVNYTPEVPGATASDRTTPASYNYPYEEVTTTNAATSLNAGGGATTFVPGTEL